MIGKIIDVARETTYSGIFNILTTQDRCLVYIDGNEDPYEYQIRTGNDTILWSGCSRQNGLEIVLKRYDSRYMSAPELSNKLYLYARHGELKLIKAAYCPPGRRIDRSLCTPAVYECETYEGFQLIDVFDTSQVAHVHGIGRKPTSPQIKNISFSDNGTTVEWDRSIETNAGADHEAFAYRITIRKLSYTDRETYKHIHCKEGDTGCVPCGICQVYSALIPPGIYKHTIPGLLNGYMYDVVIDAVSHGILPYITEPPAGIRDGPYGTTVQSFVVKSTDAPPEVPIGPPVQTCQFIIEPI